MSGERVIGISLALAALVFAAGLAVPAAAEPSMEMRIILGAASDPANTVDTEDAADSTIPVLPVVHDGDAISQTGAGGAQR
jgi:hypothetical protein